MTLSTLIPRTVTKCEAKSSPVSRKVCTFKYLQAEHNVPATNVQVRPRSDPHILLSLSSVQVSFERSSEKMGVTNCKHIKNVGELSKS